MGPSDLHQPVPDEELQLKLSWGLHIAVSLSLRRIYCIPTESLNLKSMQYLNFDMNSLVLTISVNLPHLVWEHNLSDDL